jgi:hypothetical protein
MSGRFYLDAEPLRAGRWPRCDEALDHLFTLAVTSDVELAVPEAVHLELRAQFQRRVHGDRAYIADRTFDPPAGSVDEWLASYDHLVERTCRRFSIRRIPLTERSVSELFSRAVEKQPPFGEAAGNFKDGVIVFSVLDDLKIRPATPAVLVSADKHLSGVEALPEAKAVGLRVHTFEHVSNLLRSTKVSALTEASDRSWIALIGRYSHAFELNAGDIRLVSGGGELRGALAPNDCSPAERGQMINLGGFFNSDSFGGGPARIDGTVFPNVIYSGYIEVSGSCTPTHAGEWRAPFTCEGTIRCRFKSPMIDEGPFAVVQLSGDGEATLILNENPGYPNLLEFGGLRYDFQNLTLDARRQRIPGLDVRAEL